MPAPVTHNQQSQMLHIRQHSAPQSPVQGVCMLAVPPHHGWVGGIVRTGRRHSLALGPLVDADRSSRAVLRRASLRGDINYYSQPRHALSAPTTGHTLYPHEPCTRLRQRERERPELWPAPTTGPTLYPHEPRTRLRQRERLSCGRPPPPAQLYTHTDPAHAYARETLPTRTNPHALTHTH